MPIPSFLSVDCARGLRYEFVGEGQGGLEKTREGVGGEGQGEVERTRKG